jgi:sec-independent protein translocase protein TatA
MGSLGGWEIVIILGVLVLLFGAKKLPDMARSVGQSARVFKGEMKGLKEDGKDASAPPPAAPAPLPPVQQDVTPQPAPNPTHTPGSSAQ